MKILEQETSSDIYWNPDEEDITAEPTTVPGTFVVLDGNARTEIIAASEGRKARLAEFFDALDAGISKSDMHSALSVVDDPLEGPVYSVILADDSNSPAAAWHFEIYYGNDYLLVSENWEIEYSPYFEKHAKVLAYIFRQCSKMPAEQKSELNAMLARGMFSRGLNESVKDELADMLESVGCQQIADYVGAAEKIVDSLSCERCESFQVECRQRLADNMHVLHGSAEAIAKLEAERTEAIEKEEKAKRAAEMEKIRAEAEAKGRAEAKAEASSQVSSTPANPSSPTEKAPEKALGESTPAAAKAIGAAPAASGQEGEEPVPKAAAALAEELPERGNDASRYRLCDLGSTLAPVAALEDGLKAGNDASPMYMALFFTTEQCFKAFGDFDSPFAEHDRCAAIATASVYAAGAAALVSASSGGNVSEWRDAVDACLEAARLAGCAIAEQGEVAIDKGLYDPDMISLQLANIASGADMSSVESAIASAHDKVPADSNVLSLDVPQWLDYSGLAVLRKLASADGSMTATAEADIWHAALECASVESFAKKLAGESGNETVRRASADAAAAIRPTRKALVAKIAADAGFDVRAACDRYDLWNLPGSALAVFEG